MVSVGSDWMAAPSPWARRAVEEQSAARHLEPREAAGRERVLDALAAIEVRRVDGRVLMDGHGAVAAVGGRDEAQPTAPRRLRERLLLVSGRDAGACRLDPDLQQMHGLGLGRVELAVAHARARAHALHLARRDDRAGAEAVLVLERALEHVGNDLHVAMGVCRKARPRRDEVFIDHAQRSPAHGLRVPVVRERECVKGVEPAVVRVAPLF